MSPSRFSGYSIVVSVDQNLDDRLPDLGYQVAADGDAIEATLIDPQRCGYSQERIDRLSGADANFSGIEDAFSQAASQITEDDPFLFYFSGHGDRHNGEVFLAPFDADVSSLACMISSKKLAELCGKIPSRRKVVFVDACFSGGLTVSGAIHKGAKAIPQSLISHMTSGAGVVAISSSRATETSLILAGDKNSLFTKHLVAGLRGAGGHDEQGFVRVFDLFNFLAESVRLEAPEQTPVYAAFQQDSNFPLAYCAAEGLRKNRPDESSAANQSTLQTAVDVFSSLYPTGPLDQEVWSRAGGDISRLDLSGSGRTAWTRLIRDVDRGASVTLVELISEAEQDYPKNRKLIALRKRIN